MEFQGKVQIYTGNGKGKTTAALGLALRAAGRNMRTYMAQFMKMGEYGELLAVARYLGDFVTVEQFGLPEFHHQADGVSTAEIHAAEKGLAAATTALAGGTYQVVILDEINTLLHFQIVSVEPVLRLIEKRPAGVELILTGRYAPQAVLDRADLITEMKDIRHYYEKGVQARVGIEK